MKFVVDNDAYQNHTVVGLHYCISAGYIISYFLHVIFMCTTVTLSQEEYTKNDHVVTIIGINVKKFVSL